MRNNSNHNPFARIRLRLLCCEAIVSAVCLIVLSRQASRFIDVFEGSGIRVENLRIAFLSFYADGLLIAVGSLSAVLVVSTINVSLFNNNAARNLLRIYLITMFVVIIMDLLQQSLTVGYLLFNPI